MAIVKHTLLNTRPYPAVTIGEVWFNTVSGRFYSDADAVNQTTTVPIAVEDGFKFLGWFFNSDPASHMLADAAGNITEKGYEYGAGATYWYACFERQSYKITLDPRSGASVGFAAVYRNVDGEGVFATDQCTPPQLETISLPILDGYKCRGFWDSSSSTSGTKYIDENGVISEELKVWAITSNKTLYAQYAILRKITLHPNGGVGGSDRFFACPTLAVFSSDNFAQNLITSVSIPSRNGYDFTGYYSGDVQVVYANGRINTAFAPSADMVLSAHWSEIVPGETYTLSFDAAGGTGPLSPVTVQVGVVVPMLPTVEREGYDFAGWFIGSAEITEGTIWSLESDATAVARWVRATGLGVVIDYFSLGSDWLVPISSNEGSDKKRIVVSHTGRHERNVDATSGVWRNPSVTYRVIKPGVLNVTLGRAFGGSSLITGYMIVSASVKTEAGVWPTVTVSAVANEGRNAINLFSVSVPIDGAAHAQNLMSAISGGGELQSCELEAKCDPVVCEENLMPCASDVVRGKITVSAHTLAAGNEAAPTAGGGFALVGAPKVCAESNVTSYDATVEKEII